MTVISFVVFMSAGITGPVNSLYSESLGASYAAIGLLGTVASLTTILFSTVWGRGSDRLGRRKVFLVLGLATMAVNFGLSSIVPRFGYLYPLRIVGAIARSAYGTASLALVGDLLERQEKARGRRMGTFRGLGSLGFGLMAFLSGTIADRLSLRAPFALAGGLLFVAWLISLRIKEPATDEAEGRCPSFSESLSLLVGFLSSLWRDAVAAAGRMLGAARLAVSGTRSEAGPDDASEADGALRLPLAPLLISSFLWALVTGAVYAVWANYMVHEVGYTQAAMSQLWSLASTSEFPLMIVAGWLSDRLGRLPMLCLGFLAWTLVFVGYVVAPVMPWIIFVQLTRGFAYSAFTATAMTYATEVRSRAQRGEVSGLYSASGGLGAILGAAVGGFQTQLMGFRAMIGTNAALIFCGAVYLAVVALRRRASVKKTVQ
jgi:MFS family permease